MPVPGYIRVGQVPAGNVRSDPADPLYNKPHTDTHNAIDAALEAIVAAVPDSIDDLPDVDLTGITDGQTLGWNPVTGKLEPVSAAVPINVLTDDDLGQPNGPAQLDSGGKLGTDQLPDGFGGSSVLVRPNGSAALPARQYLALRGFAISDDGEQIIVDGSLPPGDLLYLANDFVNATGTSQAITGWTSTATGQPVSDVLIVPAGKRIVWDADLGIMSSAGAKAGVSVLGPSLTGFARMEAPGTDTIAGTAPNEYRTPPNFMRWGPDLGGASVGWVGGFTSTGPTLSLSGAELHGSVYNPTSGPLPLALRFRQQTGTSGDASKTLAGSWFTYRVLNP